MRKIIIFLVVLSCWGGWQHFRTGTISHPPGTLVAGTPVQSSPRHGDRFSFKNHQLVRLQEFHMSARVLSRADYSMDRGAVLAPIDLALGWGRMSDSGVLAGITLHQTGRYYLWRSEQLPIPLDEIIASSSNMHLIPADSAVANTLRETRVGDIVEFSGALVEAKADDGWIWRSSLSRTDTGNGACELVYVEQFSIRR